MAAKKKKVQKAKTVEAPKKKRGRPPKPESEKASFKRKDPTVPNDQLSAAVKKLIDQADSLEMAVEDDKDNFSSTLGKLVEALGGRSFEHASRGPMTIMNRGHWYWRAKPNGNGSK